MYHATIVNTSTHEGAILSVVVDHGTPAAEDYRLTRGERLEVETGRVFSIRNIGGSDLGADVGHPTVTLGEDQPSSPPAPAAPAPRPAAAEQTHAEAEAMGNLDLSNPDHFTKRGAPRAAAVNEASGLETTAEERAAAWEAVQAGANA